MGGGACVAGGHAWQEGHAWSGACIAGGGVCAGGGGVHSRRACMAGEGGVHGRGHADGGGGCAWQGVMHATHAPRQILRDTVNEQAVRILLECILVLQILFC